MAGGAGQTSLPAIASATYTAASPVGDSPKSGVTVKAHVPTLNGIKKVHVTVTDGSNVLHAQEYDIARVAVPVQGGGYMLSLKFFSAANLSTSTIKVELEDANEAKGTAFTAAQP